MGVHVPGGLDHAASRTLTPPSSQTGPATPSKPERPSQRSFSAVTTAGIRANLVTAGKQGSLTVQDAFRRGRLSDLGNPKMVIFYASLVPKFLPHDEDALAVGLELVS